MNTASLLEARSLSVSAGGKNILTDASLSLQPGGLLGIIGPNGSGKSTLLRAILGLVPTTGTVLLDGTPLVEIDPIQRARRIGYLPQGIQCHWEIGVRRLVELGRLPRLSPWQTPGPEDKAAVDTAMEALDITDLAERSVGTLSGGEAMRALMARVLAGEPEIILADEPLSGLDPYHQLQLLERMRTLVTGKKHALALVLHDLTLAARFCDRLLLLDHGRVHAEGAPKEVLCPGNLKAVYHIEASISNIEVDRQAVVIPSRIAP